MQKNKNRRDSASAKKFGEFVRMICKDVVESFGASYETPETIRNTWRDTYKYSPAIEKFLIKKSKLFIATLDGHCCDSTNLGFLHAVINDMADFLSRYTMRKHTGMERKIAREELKHALWDENAYIIGLRTTQSNNRFAKNSPKYRTQKRKNEKREKARQDYEIAQQVKFIFIESAHYRKR